MNINKSLIRFISLLLVPCLLVGCFSYKRVVLPKDQRLPVEEKIVVLYSGTDKFYLYGVEITDSHIRGTVRSFDSVPSIPRKLELRIYVDGTVVIPGSLPAELSIPFTAIEKVEVYDVNVGRTVFYWVGIPAIAVGVFIVVLIAVALASGSCPFIYAFDGSSYEFEGEIYAGAVLPPLERHDYLPLTNLKPVDGEYRVKLANELREIQHTNLTELLVIDHPRGAEVLVDKYGVPHTLTELHSPLEAVTLRGEDVTDVVAAADAAAYIGGIPEEVNGDLDGLVLTFDRPRDASEAKLVFQGINSFWSDYVFSQLSELLGNRYNEWYEKQSRDPAEELRRWSLERGIPLAVYVEREGEWQFVDYYDVVGPMAAKRDVLPLDLSDIDSEEVKVKLEFGPLFWEIDYVALDFSADLPVQLHSVPLTAAVDQDGLNVSEFLLADDDRYYIQSEIGEHAFITFPAPEAVEGVARTTILHSKGHYEVLRNPQGKPDLKRLYSLKKPGRFIEFSKELFINIHRDMVASED